MPADQRQPYQDRQPRSLQSFSKSQTHSRDKINEQKSYTDGTKDKKHQGISEEEKKEFIYLDERAQDYIPGIDSSRISEEEPI